MPETPDFAKIARLLRSAAIIATHQPDVAVNAIQTELTKIWNARGAADIAKLEFEIPNVWTSPEPAGPLTRAIQTLDR